MKKIVFISSTYEDLQEYRKVVWKLLEKYDVHVIGMEKFGARRDTPIETCLKEVQRSDIYIGIISHIDVHSNSFTRKWDFSPVR